MARTVTEVIAKFIHTRSMPSMIDMPFPAIIILIVFASLLVLSIVILALYKCIRHNGKCLSIKRIFTRLPSPDKFKARMDMVERQTAMVLASYDESVSLGCIWSSAEVGVLREAVGWWVDYSEAQRVWERHVEEEQARKRGSWFSDNERAPRKIRKREKWKEEILDGYEEDVVDMKPRTALRLLVKRLEEREGINELLSGLHRVILARIVDAKHISPPPSFKHHPSPSACSDESLFSPGTHTNLRSNKRDGMVQIPYMDFRPFSWGKLNFDLMDLDLESAARPSRPRAYTFGRASQAYRSQSFSLATEFEFER